MKIYFVGNTGCTQYKSNVVNMTNIKPLISYFDVVEERDGDMKIYFAGGENKSWLKAIEESGSQKSLYSYYYLLKSSYVVERADQTQKEIFLDSGAYSAKTKGVAIDIDDYIDFIKKHQDRITVYANLDVIGNATKTAKNQKYMEEKGLNPLPVFHMFEDFDVLKGMIERYDYIAIGGVVGIVSHNEQSKFLEKCWSIISKEFKRGRKVKIHGFGITSAPFLKRYPFYSVDSTSWLGGSMRAEIYEFNPYMGSMKAIKVKKQNKSTWESISFIDGVDKKWFERVVHNAIEWIKFEKYITKLWKERGIVWEDI